MTSGSSLTPLRSTVWQPSGIPASASMPSARTAAGDAAPDPKHLEVRNRAQAPADLIDPAVREEQGIAARHDDVADLVVLLEIAKRRFEVRQRDLLGVADLAPARTEAAVGRADRRHQEQRPVRVAVRDVRDGRV